MIATWSWQWALAVLLLGGIGLAVRLLRRVFHAGVGKEK